MIAKGSAEKMESGVKIAICDDEAAGRESVERMCRAFFEEKERFVGMPDIQVFASGKEMAEIMIFCCWISKCRSRTVSTSRSIMKRTGNGRESSLRPAIGNGYWKHSGRMLSVF